MTYMIDTSLDELLFVSSSNYTWSSSKPIHHAPGSRETFSSLCNHEFAIECSQVDGISDAVINAYKGCMKGPFFQIRSKVPTDGVNNFCLIHCWWYCAARGRVMTSPCHLLTRQRGHMSVWTLIHYRFNLWSNQRSFFWKVEVFSRCYMRKTVREWIKGWRQTLQAVRVLLSAIVSISTYVSLSDWTGCCSRLRRYNHFHQHLSPLYPPTNLWKNSSSFSQLIYIY